MGTTIKATMINPQANLTKRLSSPWGRNNSRQEKIKAKATTFLIISVITPDAVASLSAHHHSDIP